MVHFTVWASVVDLVAATMTLFAALAALLQAYRAQRESQRTLRHMRRVHREVNSQLPALVDAIRAAAYQLGRHGANLPDPMQGPYWRPARPEDRPEGRESTGAGGLPGPG